MPPGEEGGRSKEGAPRRERSPKGEHNRTSPLPPRNVVQSLCLEPHWSLAPVTHNKHRIMHVRVAHPGNASVYDGSRTWRAVTLSRTTVTLISDTSRRASRSASSASIASAGRENPTRGSPNRRLWVRRRHRQRHRLSHCHSQWCSRRHIETRSTDLPQPTPTRHRQHRWKQGGAEGYYSLPPLHHSYHLCRCQRWRWLTWMVRAVAASAAAAPRGRTTSARARPAARRSTTAAQISLPFVLTS